MIRKLILLALVLTGVSCKSPDARRPIQRSSSTFIEESVARNKKLIEAEEALIANIIRNDSTNTYLASESGFGIITTYRTPQERYSRSWRRHYIYLQYQRLGRKNDSL